MSGDSKGIMAQIIVGVVTGIIVGILAGSGTAYHMAQMQDKKLDVHIVETNASIQTLKRDLAANNRRDLAAMQVVVNMNATVTTMAKDVAVMANEMTHWQATSGGITERRTSGG
jgi:hypothetical protein